MIADRHDGTSCADMDEALDNAYDEMNEVRHQLGMQGYVSPFGKLWDFVAAAVEQGPRDEVQEGYHSGLDLLARHPGSREDSLAIARRRAAFWRGRIAALSVPGGDPMSARSDWDRCWSAELLERAAGLRAACDRAKVALARWEREHARRQADLAFRRRVQQLMHWWRATAPGESR